MAQQMKKSELLLDEAIKFDENGKACMAHHDTSTAGRMFAERNATFAEALHEERSGN